MSSSRRVDEIMKGNFENISSDQENLYFFTPVKGKNVDIQSHTGVAKFVSKTQLLKENEDKVSMKWINYLEEKLTKRDEFWKNLLEEKLKERDGEWEKKLKDRIHDLEKKLLCPICQSREKDVVYPCGHCGCSLCFQNHPTCYYKCKKEQRLYL